ncbi:hypothetical protein ABIB62_002285 [Mucilaginibacter sp. UYP25]|uniref:hypothetical protein n=1 Tax=unclassified Mucilaginibacter TaxID=2617802 RepID=UPI00339243D7
MIRVNLVARIAGDKNSFPNLVDLCHKLKQRGLRDFVITFIGAVEDESIYRNIIRMAHQLGVTENIAFTKRSIPMAELTDELKSGYFLNFTVGGFMGYSSIDSINLGFKAIFCNCDDSLADEQYDYINICPHLDAVMELLILIDNDAPAFDAQILANNQGLKKSYLLTTNDAATLKSLMTRNG